MKQRKVIQSRRKFQVGDACEIAYGSLFNGLRGKVMNVFSVAKSRKSKIRMKYEVEFMYYNVFRHVNYYSWQLKKL
jgi:hypothetical protein